MNKIEHSFLNQNLKIGQFFTRTDENEDEETYIVAKVNGKFTLVCLDDGEYWTNVTEKITDVFGSSSQRERFKLVTHPFTITPSV